MMAGHSDRDRDTVELRTRCQPRLAVLIPVFNDQVGLERSLASLKAEAEEFDVYVVDDGSDSPVRIPPDLPYNVYLIRQELNRGITAALNAGLSLIADRGYQYVARLDACDLSLPGRFAAQISFLDSHPQHAVIGTAVRHVDIHGNSLFDFCPPRNHDALVRFFRYRAGLIHPSVMMRMQALLTCGFYRNAFAGGEDYELFIRLSKTHKLANLSTIFVVITVRPHSISSRRRSMTMTRLRFLSSYFDPWSIHSYLGIIANALLLLPPRSLILYLRRLGARWALHRSGERR
jgi:glycosyltransferase involved in cell wall biosynthesis